MNLLLVTGVIGSGKDTYAKEYIKNHPNERVEIIRFATPLRNICAKLYNFDANDEVAYEKFKAENRRAMVDLGQAMKDEMGLDIFAVAAGEKMWPRSRENITFIIPDFRFPVEFGTMMDFFVPNVVFCNYHSERYELRPEQVTEQMAIWLVEQGYQHGQVFSALEFEKIMQKYQLNLVD